MSSDRDIVAEEVKMLQEQEERRKLDEIAQAKTVERQDAVLLTMLGDMPSLDAKPKDNILFVARLNHITDEESLRSIAEIRTGLTVKSVDIKKDPDTKESRGFAFIEFETDRDASIAYKKLQTIVVDDRRLHVDFAQSVKRDARKPQGGRHREEPPPPPPPEAPESGERVRRKVKRRVKRCDAKKYRKD
ncbi:RNA recognition motif [Carpediemonas membranifera]|uniref:peptidylprolyl isomerase n=1 Tax=Carpediemonas membranifera TaxID=201153 RepID=A0A8J6B8X9_9EUKA|nr:RNA recognition motif [Carpediemonas membranifera]|eukprot:KAG9395639.1 RNA recognition motif [Carpediemonas membranifera]